MFPQLTEKLVGFAGPGGVLLMFLLLLATVVKALPPMFKTKTDSDGSLRADLLGQISKLNDRHDALEREMREERERCEVELQAMRAQHSAEIQVLRHRLNNETMSLDALLMLMEAAPDRVSENIAKIKDLRAERARTIALEQGALAGAKVAGGKER